MTGIYFLLPVLLTVLISFLVVRAGAIALMMTGLDRKRAIFQSLSSFTGTGFTTREAETVVHHPTRRKIVSWLMILGNAGFVTLIVTTTSTMVTSKGITLPINIIVLAAGSGLIYKLVSGRKLMRKFEVYIEKQLIKSPAFIEEAPMEDLLHLMEGYGLVKGIIEEGSPLIGNTVHDLGTHKGNIRILGIERKDDWMPTPGDDEKVQDGDRLIIYGNMAELKKIFSEE